MTPKSFAKPPVSTTRRRSQPNRSSEMTLQTAWRRVHITMRWSRRTIEVLEARGPRWSNFAEEAVKRALKRGAR